MWATTDVIRQCDTVIHTAATARIFPKTSWEKWRAGMGSKCTASRFQCFIRLGHRVE